MYRNIDVQIEMDAQLTYSALEDYLGKLDHDRRTRFDGDPGYGPEDETFLTDAAQRVRNLLTTLKRDHPAIVMRG